MIDMSTRNNFDSATGINGQGIPWITSLKRSQPKSTTSSLNKVAQWVDRNGVDGVEGVYGVDRWFGVKF